MPTATAARRSASSARCGSPASTPQRARWGMSYSVFMNGLKKAAIEIDRKVLADLAVADKAAFAKIANQVKAKLGA